MEEKKFIYLDHMQGEKQKNQVILIYIVIKEMLKHL